MLPERRFFWPLLLLVVGVLSLSLIPGAWADQSYVLSREIKGGLFGGQVSLALPNDVAIGPNGNIFIADSSNFSAIVLDEYENLVRLFTPSGDFLPEYVSVSPAGEVFYVTNLFNNVYRVGTAPDSPFTSWGSSGSGNGQFSSPTGIATGPDGTVYVADTNNNRIQKFTPNGAFITFWGSQGSGDGQFQSPQAVAVDSRLNVVLVADTDNNRVEAFDTSGNFLLAAGTAGSAPGQFFAPAGVAFGTGTDLSVYISEVGNNRVQKFGLDGTFLAEIGVNQLSSPHGVAVDRGGNVYVADTFNNRIAIFAPEIVVIDKGIGQTVVNKPSAANVTVDIIPNVYWNGVLADVYAWIDAPAVGIKAYFRGTNDWVPFVNLSDMAAFLTDVPVTTVNDFVATLVDSTAGLPSTSFTLNVCLDRDRNGTYNPSSSVCGSLLIFLQ